MKSILKIVRIQNLFIVAATLLLMRYCIIQPLLKQKGMDLQLSDLNFLLLTLAVILITAGGYVINDYFDTKTDLVNRPQTVIVGRSLSRRTAILLHWILNITGIILGFLVSYNIGRPILAVVFVLTTGILWFYSTLYKRQFLIGNLIVAILTGLVPLMALVFELPKVYSVYWDIIINFKLNVSLLSYWVGGYALFAFLLTLSREIIKDIEDFEGDFTYGRNTLPVYLGIKTSKIITASIITFTLVAISYLFGAYLNLLPSGKFDLLTFLYFIICLIIPLFILLVMVLTAEKKEDYHRASNVNKLIMMFGLFYTLIFRFLIA